MCLCGWVGGWDDVTQGHTGGGVLGQNLVGNGACGEGVLGGGVEAEVI
jgi:hypothetical protein